MLSCLVFGFGHRARHGKDITAKAIKDARCGEFDIRLYSFAEELKREVNERAIAAGGMKQFMDSLDLPDWVIYEENPDMSDPLCPLGKQRTLLQWYGTEYRRAQNPDYWVNILKARLEEENPEIAFITDVRMPNEFAFCKEYGEVIKVVRPDFENINGHISEEALASVPDTEWSAVIYNDCSREELASKAVFVFDDLMERVRGAEELEEEVPR